MSHWLILHTGSPLSEMLSQQLGSRVRASIHVKDLINQVAIHSCMESGYEHVVLYMQGHAI